MSSPSSREKIEASRNQPSVLIPTRPTAAASSMWTMPASNVLKTRGAMIILIRRRTAAINSPNPAAALAAPAGVIQ